MALPDGKHFELFDGILREKSSGGLVGWIGVEVACRIRHWADKPRRGDVFGPTASYQCFGIGRDTVLKPSCSFVATGRLPRNRIPRGHIEVVPDLTVEVIAPGDSYLIVDAKIHEYLDAGVRLVWIINPDNRTVKVYRHDDRRPVELTDGDQLDGFDVLPGFACAVADLFQPVDRDND